MCTGVCVCLSIFVIGVVVTVEIEGNTNQAIVTLCVLCLSECLYSQQHNWTQDSGCLLLCATRPMQMFWTTILLWTSERWDLAINSICIHIQISFCILPSLFLSPKIILTLLLIHFSHPGVAVNTDTSYPTTTPINTSPSGTNPLPSTTPTLGDSSATWQVAVGAPVMLVALLLTALLLRN